MRMVQSKHLANLTDRDQGDGSFDGRRPIAIAPSIAPDSD